MKECKHPGVAHGKKCPTCNVYVMKAAQQARQAKAPAPTLFMKVLGIDLQPEENEQ
jgi:hypothetical protein